MRGAPAAIPANGEDGCNHELSAEGGYARGVGPSCQPDHHTQQVPPATKPQPTTTSRMTPKVTAGRIYGDMAADVLPAVRFSPRFRADIVPWLLECRRYGSPLREICRSASSECQREAFHFIPRQQGAESSFLGPIALRANCSARNGPQTCPN